MAEAITGTLEMVGLACLMGVPIGIGGGIYLSENRGQLAQATFCRQRHDGSAISPFSDWQPQAWAGALVLAGIVLALELGVRWVTTGKAIVAL